MGTPQIIMPENYIAMFNAPQKEQAKSIVEQAEPALQKVLGGNYSAFSGSCSAGFMVLTRRVSGSVMD